MFANRFGFRAFLFVVLLLTFGAAVPTRADCCNTVCGGLCGDCTNGTLCCATGGRNIFCCNCEGTCRSGNCSVCTDCGSSIFTRKRFDAIDRNRDGALSRAEVSAWIKETKSARTPAEVRKGFDRADANHNGRIEPVEFDKTLK